MPFDKWDKRFIEMTDVIGNWSSCFQANRKMGCVIVRNKRILTTGYNGAPAGIVPCTERGVCMRRERNIPSGEQAQLCYAVHAEQNALIQAAKMGVCVDEATLYCTYSPCVICGKLIINAGITRLVYRHDYPDDFSRQLLAEAGVSLEKYEEG